MGRRRPVLVCGCAWRSRKTGGQAWTRKDLWSEMDDWTQWFGVTARAGFVTRIDLSNNNLVGTWQ